MFYSYVFAILAAFFWGAGFIGSRLGLEGLDAMWITFFRFIIALLISAPFAILTFSKDEVQKFINLKILGKLFLTSILLCLMMYLQVEALSYTSIHKSGFIIILYAFFTPLIMLFLFKFKLSSFYWALLGLSMFGMMIMFDLEFNEFNFGDFLSFICALVSAFQIISISNLTKDGLCTKLINLFQLGIISFVMFIVAMMSSGPTQVINLISSPSLHSNTIYGLLFMGVFSTAIGFYMQIKSQQKLKSHIASLIFLTESPIAAFLAFFMLNEHMSINAIIGSLIVLFCVALLPFEKQIKRKLKYSIIRKAYFAIK